MSQTTLTSLPKEVRKKILAEALSVNNNTIFDAYNDYQSFNAGSAAEFTRLAPVPHERKLEWNITSPIFFINKQTSVEALECFHRENTLVLIQTIGYPFLENCASQIIPMCQITKPKKDVALHITLVFQSEGLLCYERVRDSQLAVMAARYLPILVDLINATSIPRVRRGVRPKNNDLFFLQTPKIYLHFNTGSKFYAKEVNDVSTKLVDGLKGIRKFQWREWRPRGPPVVGPSMDRQFGVIGLSDVKTNELLMASNLPCWTAAQCVEEAKRFKEQGDRLAEAGGYAAARGQYILSSSMVSEQPVPRARVFHSLFVYGSSINALKIMLTSWSATARVGEKLSPISKEACALERMLLHVLKVAFGIGMGDFTVVEKEELLVSYGKELLRHHEYDKFHEACAKAIRCNSEEYYLKESEAYGITSATTTEERKALRSACEKHIQQCLQEKWQWLRQFMDHHLKEKKMKMLKLGGTESL